MPEVDKVIQFFLEVLPVPIQKLESDFLREYGVDLYIKREDLLHPEISGNKWRKLKYNLIEAAYQRKDTLLTFGGAYSNHIAAVAAASEALNFKTIGFIRGEKHPELNPTLQRAKAQGMELIYTDRETYRLKNSTGFQEKLKTEFPDAYILPEGGTNNLAVKGCAEIIAEINIPFDIVCVAAGTGGTAAGLLSGLNGAKELLAFSALKGNFLKAEINALTTDFNGEVHQNWELETNFHFGGYAKVKPELLKFIEAFKEQFQIQLEPVYTGKMMFGIFDLIRKERFKKGTKVLAIHTGGLQGLTGFKNNALLAV